VRTKQPHDALGREAEVAEDKRILLNRGRAPRRKKSIHLLLCVDIVVAHESRAVGKRIVSKAVW
jgi:hypothetical protein